MAGVMLVPAMAQDFSEFSRARDAELSRSLVRARPTAPRAEIGKAAPSQSAPARAVAARVLPARAAPGRATGKFALLPEGPLLLVVSLDKQRLSVYSKGHLVETTTVSTGASGDPTPSGVFAVIEKQEKHFSNIFGGAPMPFMQRLTMSGVALHSGYVTGRPASHGCVRLPHDYARRLFQGTNLGVRVIVSADDPVPVEVGEMRLLDQARVAAATRGAPTTDTGILKVSTTSVASSPHASTAVDRSIDRRTGKPKGPLSLLRDEMLKTAPVSLLVSRAEGRVYVRHMFEPQMEAEIAIGDPGQPIGTHVYTLTDMQPDVSEQRWSAVTVKLVPRKIAAIRVLSGRHSRAARAAGAPQPSGPRDEGMPSTAVEAVQRFSLPPAIVAHIAPLIRPGLSIVVTDLPLSKRVQTGWTDIIVTP